MSKTLLYCNVKNVQNVDTDKQCIHTCSTTVAAALDLLFTVLTIKIILTGRTGINCKGKDKFQ